MPFSATVTFDDGSTHTYDKIPDGTTRADTASRVARDYPGKSIASLMRETPAAPPAGRVAGKFGDTSVSAAPQGLLENLKALGGEFIGRTQERAHEDLQAMRDRASHKRSFIPFVETGRDIANLANEAGVILSPAGALGDMAGVHGLVPNYGAPGQAPGAERKFGDLAEFLVPISGKPAAEATVAALRLAKGLGAHAGGAVARPIANVLKYGFESKPLIEASRVNARAMAQQLRGADIQTAQAAQHGLMGEKGLEATNVEAANTALRQQAEAQARAEVKPINVGSIKTPTERNLPLRASIEQGAEDSLKTQQELDARLRALSEEEAKKNSAERIYANDLPEAKSALKESEAAVNFNPATAPTEAARPTTGEVKAHSMIVDALKNNRVELTQAEAANAKALGHEVEEVPTAQGDIPGPSKYYRTFKTPIEAITNFRRFAGKMAKYGKPVEGFEGISANFWDGVYKKFGSIEDAYLKETAPALKESWTRYFKDAAKYDSNLGRGATQTQGDSAQIRAFANQFGQQIKSGGKEAYLLAKSQAKDPQAARAWLEDEIKSVFHDPVTGAPLPYSQVKTKYVSDLKDILPAEPELKATVERHVNDLIDAEQAGVEAKNLGGVANAHTQEAAAARSRAETLRGQFEAAEAKSRARETMLNKIDTMQPDKLDGAAQSLLDDMHNGNHISAADHKAATEQLAFVRKKYADTKRRNAAVKTLLIAAAGGGVGAKLFLH